MRKEVAAATNGQFGYCAEEDVLRVTIRLRQGCRSTGDLTIAAERHIAAVTGLRTKVDWQPIPEEPGIAVDFEHKFKHTWTSRTALGHI